MDVNLRGDQEGGIAKWTAFVTNIDYDAKGQRVLIEYSNGVKTSYKYDPLTFRLSHLTTVKGTGIACVDELTDAERSQRSCPKTGPVCHDLQNLWYTYDPAGNITYIRDDAQQTVFFDNQCVEPSNDYIYDAIYRLIQAKGREHIGQVGSPQTTYNDAGRVNPTHPNDGQAMRNYTERYEHDEVGNIERFWHGVGNGAGTWQRTYSHDEESLIPEDAAEGRKNNRLTKTTISGSGFPAADEPYTHDAHGNMLSMPHLQALQWDFKDQLSLTQRQMINEEDEEGVQHHGERTYYVYDANGQRVRKVTEYASGHLKDERIYLGGFEIYLKHSEPNAGLVRETLQVMDDRQLIALVETRNDVHDGSPQQLIRYQFGNHLGSASLEVDDKANIISYEEYYPYGSTSYQAVRNDIQVPLKRYRYSGKERDEESGLYYHGARYYAPWLGRWTACDPLFVELNLFTYTSNNPIILIDEDGNVPKPKKQLKRLTKAARRELRTKGMAATVRKIRQQTLSALLDWTRSTARKKIRRKHLRGRLNEGEVAPLHGIFSDVYKKSEKKFVSLLEEVVEKGRASLAMNRGKIRWVFEMEKKGVGVVREKGIERPAKFVRYVTDLAGNPITAYPTKRMRDIKKIKGFNVVAVATGVIVFINVLEDEAYAAAERGYRAQKNWENESFESSFASWFTFLIWDIVTWRSGSNRRVPSHDSIRAAGIEFINRLEAEGFELSVEESKELREFAEYTYHQNFSYGTQLDSPPQKPYEPQMYLLPSGVAFPF